MYAPQPVGPRGSPGVQWYMPPPGSDAGTRQPLLLLLLLPLLPLAGQTQSNVNLATGSSHEAGRLAVGTIADRLPATNCRHAGGRCDVAHRGGPLWCGAQHVPLRRHAYQPPPCARGRCASWKSAADMRMCLLTVESAMTGCRACRVLWTPVAGYGPPAPHHQQPPPPAVQASRQPQAELQQQLDDEPQHAPQDAAGDALTLAASPPRAPHRRRWM